jgi:hypothetical protein
MSNVIPMLVVIEDEDRAAAAALIKLARYLPDSKAQAAAFAHALAMARRREREKACPDCRNKDANIRDMRECLSQFEKSRDQ